MRRKLRRLSRLLLPLLAILLVVLVLKLALFNTELFQASGVLTDLFNFKAIILAVVLLICTRYVNKLKSLHPIVFIAASALIGVLFAF